MNIREMAALVAKVTLGDNRQVDELTIAYWHELVGDMTFEEANLALRRFRRERPGVYLEPGHLLELAGIVDEPLVPDIQSELEAGWAAEDAPLGDPVEQLAAMPWAKPFEAEGI